MGSERFGMLSSPSLTLSDMSTDTPRNPVEAGASPWFLPPVSPGNHRRTKSRAGHIGHRQNSLTESKVLLVTEAKRSHSVINPDLFQYHNHFEFLRLIGKTATSEVFCVRHRASGELFAVKRSRRRFRSKMQRERCLREVRAVAALPAHANIVSQYRAWQEGGHFHIQMDLCQGGTLLEALGQSHRMDDAALWRVAADVAAGLAFLHESGILHLDIKPENIYRDLGGAWRIGDFGLAVANESRDWEEGDGDYVAPELLNGAEPGPPADMFSLGASLYECATGRKLPRSRGATAGPDPALAARPPAFLGLLGALLAGAPTSRPSAAQVLSFVRRQAGEAADGGAVEGSATRASASVPAVPMGEIAGMPTSPPSPAFAMCDLSSRAAAAAAGCMAVRSLSPPPPDFSFAGAGGAGAAIHTQRTPGAPRRGAAAERWQPALSPLLSEGRLTPGSGAATPSPGAAGGPVPHCTPVLTRASRRPALAPLQLPRGGAGGADSPRCAPAGPAAPPSAGAGSARHPDSSSGSFVLRRRELPSPDSCDACSDASFSCDTGTTLGGSGWGGHGAASELDFVDIAASSPQASTARPRASGAEDQDALSDRGSPWRGGPVEDGSSSMPVSPFECIGVQDGMYSPPVHPSRRQSGQGWPGEAYTCEARPAFFPAVPTPPPSSLAWDLYASPEFLMQLAPGSAAGSAPTHPRDKEVGQRTFSLRRFPTLDTIGALHLPEKPTDASESLAGAREAGQDPRPQLASRRPLLHSLSCEVSPAAHQHTKQFASLPGTPA
ncbi:hypothetical protein ACKKBF_B20120 [Auxenochlorella protothecoides x Auxenochlorella symbiontica]